MKKFEYDYGNIFKKVLSYLLSIICNYFLLLVILFLSSGVLFSIYDSFNNSFVSKILIMVLFVGDIILFLKFSFETFRKRNVVLHDSFLIAKRGNFDFIPFGFKWKIEYSDMIRCERYEVKRFILNDGKRMAIPFYNNNSFVRIELEKGTSYYFQIKQPEEFVNEVNQRITASKENNE